MSKIRAALVTVYCIGLAVAFSWPLLTRLSATGVWDWSEAAAHYEAARQTVLYYKQWPLWNPFICGGIPALANPQAYWLSLTGFLSLFMGSVAGPKLAVLIYVLMGGGGIWLLARKLGASDLGSLLAVPVYMTSGFLATRLAAGQFLWLTLAYVPWVFYGYERARQSWWWLVLGGGALAAIGIEGRSYLVVYVIIMLWAYGLMIDVLNRGRTWGLVRSAVLIVIAFCLSAWKFLPDWFFLTQARVSLEDSPALPAQLLAKMLLLPQAIPEEQIAPAVLPWVEYGAYIGWLPLGLAGLALMSSQRRKLIPIVLAGLVMLTVALSVPQGNILEFWPVLREFRNYHRAIGMVVFVLAVLAARGLDVVVERVGFRPQALAVGIKGGVILLVIIDLLMVTNAALGWGFAKVAEMEGPNEFPVILPVFQHESGYNDPFSIVRKKRGAKEACPAMLYTWLPGPVGTKPIGSNVIAVDDEKYRGEVYLTSGEGTVRLVQFTPNKITLDVNVTGEAYVAVNQNYAPGWKASKGRVEDNGEMLIGFAVPSGHYELVLSYWPPGFNMGLVISGLTGGFLVLLAIRQSISKETANRKLTSGKRKGES